MPFDKNLGSTVSSRLQMFRCELDALRKELWGANCCSDMTERTRYVSYGPATAALSHLHQAAKTWITSWWLFVTLSPLTQIIAFP